MSILGIGIDMVNIARIEKITRRWHQKFLDRVFTKAEQDYCLKKQKAHVHFSGRFAVKEALLKALGTGLSEGMSWKEIETLRDESGRPVVRLSGRVQHVAEKIGVSEIFSSISHDKDYAIGQVILQRHPDKDKQ